MKQCPEERRREITNVMSTDRRARLSNAGSRETNMCGNEGESFFFFYKCDVSRM